MKKIIGILLVILTLCSCGGKQEIKPRLQGISFTAEVTYYNEAYSLEGEILSDGTLQVAVTAPEELKGFNIHMINEDITVEYKGLTYSPIEGTMPFSGVMAELYAPIRQIVGSDIMADTEGKIKGGEGVRAYCFTFSPTGLPQKLEIPDESFEIRFYNVTIKEDVND